MDGIPWKNIEKFGDWEFFGLYPLPGAPRNFHLIAKESFRYQDCIASADAMISSSATAPAPNASSTGCPSSICPASILRIPVLHRAVSEWGHGYLLSKEDYCGLNWGSALRLIEKREKPRPYCRAGRSGAQGRLKKLIRMNKPWLIL